MYNVTRDIKLFGFLNTLYIKKRGKKYIFYNKNDQSTSVEY